jgi:hypothetical protein
MDPLTFVRLATPLTILFKINSIQSNARLTTEYLICIEGTLLLNTLLVYYSDDPEGVKWELGRICLFLVGKWNFMH